MLINLFRLLLVLLAVVLLRRFWRGLQTPPRREPRRTTEPPRSDSGEDPLGQQPIDEADYEELP